MQTIQPPPPIKDTQQLELDEFQDQFLTQLKTDSTAQQSFITLIASYQPLNGVICITKVTRSYAKYLKSQGNVFKKRVPIVSYIDMKLLIENFKGNHDTRLLAILTQYQNLSDEDKKQTYLFRFQTPCSYDPNVCRQNYVFVKQADLFTV